MPGEPASSGLQQLLLEVTSKEILQDVDPGAKRRSGPLASRLVRFKGNVITFHTTAKTTSGVRYWIQNVQLVGLRKQLDKVRDGKSTLVKAIRAAVQRGDVRVHCNCPAQKWWGYAYIATQLGYKYGRKQRIFPQKRNPKLKGTVCKHLVNALGTLPFNVQGLAKRAKRRGLGASDEDPKKARKKEQDR